MTLDYRLPTTGVHRIQRVLAQLEQAEQLGALAIAGKFVAGGSMSLIGPFLVTILTVDVRDRWAMYDGWNFTAVFVAISLVLVPLLMWLERRTRGRFLSDSLEGDMLGPASSYGEFEWRGTRLLSMVYTEIALLGPRMIWSGIDALRTRDRLDAEMRVLAAGVVIELLDADESRALEELVHPDRDARDLIRAVRYLKKIDWVDISARRDRIWLSSRLRERFSSPD